MHSINSLIDKIKASSSINEIRESALDWYLHQASPVFSDFEEMADFLLTLNSRTGMTNGSEIRDCVIYPVLGSVLKGKLTHFKDNIESLTDLEIITIKSVMNHYDDLVYESLCPAEMLKEARVNAGASLDDYLLNISHLGADNRVFNYMMSLAKEIDSLERKEEYDTDIGHGIRKRSMYFLQYRLVSLLDPKTGKWKSEAYKNKDLTILVLDDEMPETWYDRLIKAGFKEEGSAYFSSPKDALQDLKRNDYDVVLTDYNLSDERINGVEFARKVRSMKGRNGPFIALFSSDYAVVNTENKIRGNTRTGPFSEINLFGKNFRKRPYIDASFDKPIFMAGSFISYVLDQKEMEQNIIWI